MCIKEMTLLRNYDWKISKFRKHIFPLCKHQCENENACERMSNSISTFYSIAQSRSANCQRSMAWHVVSRADLWLFWLPVLSFASVTAETADRLLPCCRCR